MRSIVGRQDVGAVELVCADQREAGRFTCAMPSIAGRGFIDYFCCAHFSSDIFSIMPKIIEARVGLVLPDGI